MGRPTLPAARRTTIAGGSALVAAALPLLILGGSIAAARPDVIPDGDYAVDEMAMMNARHFAQLVGNYSREGWHHPGPAWFYMLNIVYSPLGAQSWAFWVALIVAHAAAVALFVGLLWRRGGALLAGVGALCMLLLMQEHDVTTFWAVWPPFALILPMALFLALAAYGAAGSTPGMVGALVAGSYLAQLHVGTVPTVIGVLGVMIMIRAVAMILDRRSATAGETWGRATVGWVTAGLALFVLMCIPPLVDEVTGHPGNLTQLFNFFRQDRSPHPLGEALSAFGRQLAVFPFGHTESNLLYADWSSTPSLRGVVIAGFIAAAAGLVTAGALLGDRFAVASGVIALTSSVTATWSITHIDGQIYTYLLLWMTVLPVIVVVGYAELLIAARLWERVPIPATARRPIAIVLVGALGLGTITLVGTRAHTYSTLPSLADVQFEPDVRPAWNVVDAHLGGMSAQPVLIRIRQQDRWPVATAIALQLMKRGWRVAVTQDWVFLFGDQARPIGNEHLELIVTGPTDLSAAAQLRAVTVLGTLDQTALLVRPLAPGDVP